MAWIGGALALGGALLSSGSAGDAADAQSQSTAEAIAEERRQYDQNRTDLAPWRTVGGQAITRLGDLMGLGGTTRTAAGATALAPTRAQFTTAAVPGTAPGGTPGDPSYDWSQTPTGGTPGRFDQAGFDNATAAYNSARTKARSADSGYLTRRFTLADFWDDPVTKASYQQGLDQGTKAISNQAARAGSLNSGATLKALSRFGTDYTGNQAGQSQARYVNDQTNLYNRFAGLAGSGQNAANTTVASGSNSANTIGGLISAGGNARGAAAIAGGNAIGGAFGNAGNQYSQQQTLNQILNRGGVAGGGGGVGTGWSGNIYQP